MSTPHDDSARSQRLEAIIELGRSLVRTHDSDGLIGRILADAIRVIPAAETGVLMLYDPDIDRLVVRHAVGFQPSIYSITIPLSDSLAGRAFRSGEPTLYRTRDSMIQQVGEELRQTLAREFNYRCPESSMVTPLHTPDSPIGVMSVQNFSTTQVFDDVDLRLFEALGQSAASTIVNARLTAAGQDWQRQLEQVHLQAKGHRSQLQRRLRVGETMAVVVRDGLSVEELLTRLARLTSARLFLCDVAGLIRVSCPLDAVLTAADLAPGHREMITAALDEASATRSVQRVTLDEVVLIAPIPVGAEILGFLVALFGDTEPDAVHTEAICSAALVAATDFAERRTREEGRIRCQTEIVDRLLRGTPPSGADGPFVVAVGRVRHDPLSANRETEAGATATRALFSLAEREFGSELIAATLRDDLVVLVWSSAVEVAGRLLAVVEQYAQLDDTTTDAFVVSDVIETAAEFCDAFTETQLVSELRRRTEQVTAVHTVRSLGAFRMILRSAGAAEIVRLCNDTLGAVLQHDRQRGIGLLDTLRSYFDHGGALKPTAQALTVHPHTVQYRLGRVEALAGLRLSDPQDRLTLELCVRIIDSAALAEGLGRS